MKKLIELKDVVKEYLMGKEKIAALSGISLWVKEGDFLAIVGPSGSGKSTMMNMVGALDVPTKGDIYLDGRDIAKMEESELAQIRGRKIGFIFQTFNLIPTLTALENVALPMMFQKIPREERIKRAKQLLKQVKLHHRINHLPSELSGGERQRVAIARALANNPEVILADEPTGNLDSKTGREIVKILTNLNREGRTIIMVTHDLEIANYAKQIIKLKDGRIEKAKR